MIIFIIVSLYLIKDFKKITWVEDIKFHFSFFILFSIPLLSGIWGGNWNNEFTILITKLPLLLLPISFIAFKGFKLQHWRLLLKSCLLIVFISTIYCVINYFFHFSKINQSYLQSQTIPVFMENDHVRYSLLVALSMCSSLIAFNLSESKLTKYLSLFLSFWFFIFLHLLAARTGLFTAYIFLVGFIINVHQKNKSNFLIITIVTCFISLISIFNFPSFINRFHYLRYNFQLIQQHKFISSTTDVNRLLSIKAATHILFKHPLGVGFGNINENVTYWFENNVNGFNKSDITFPSNEWLIHGCGLGWPGIILFTIAVILLFKIKLKNLYLWRTFCISIISGLLFESTLETQFGIYIYCFVLLSWFYFFKFKNKAK